MVSIFQKTEIYWNIKTNRRNAATFLQFCASCSSGLFSPTMGLCIFIKNDQRRWTALTNCECCEEWWKTRQLSDRYYFESRWEGFWWSGEWSHLRLLVKTPNLDGGKKGIAWVTEQGSRWRRGVNYSIFPGGVWSFLPLFSLLFCVFKSQHALKIKLNISWKLIGSISIIYSFAVIINCH